MKKNNELFVAFDTKKNHAVAVADFGRKGEIRYLGEIDSSLATVERVPRPRPLRAFDRREVRRAGLVCGSMYLI